MNSQSFAQNFPSSLILIVTATVLFIIVLLHLNVDSSIPWLILSTLAIAATAQVLNWLTHSPQLRSQVARLLCALVCIGFDPAGM
jgi:MFS superfamily sulfate permease-like transporter